MSLFRLTAHVWECALVQYGQFGKKPGHYGSIINSYWKNEQMLSEMLRVERLSVVLELEETELQPELQKMETKKNRQRLVSHGIKSEYLPVVS